MIRDIIVLFSGGVDSTVLARMAGEQLAACVFIDYGQAPAEQERATARDWCERHGVDLIEHECRLPVSTMNIGTGAAGLRIVPFRNFVFVGIAAAHAVDLGVSRVWYGALADDRDYPDCTSGWVDSVSMSLLIEGVSVEAPLIGDSKASVMSKARGLRVDVSRCWSCYEPDGDGRPCGTCDSCEARS